MTYVYLADIRCLQCGRDLETVQVDSPMSMPRLGRASRCQACGGQPMFTGEYVRRWQGEPIVIEPKPLGRPRNARSGACLRHDHRRCSRRASFHGDQLCTCKCHTFEDDASAPDGRLVGSSRP